MSVMGQTQTLIGTMIVLSSAAAYYLTPWAGLVTVFFGAALLLAGIAGRCPMSDFLCRMPWNRSLSAACGVGKK